MIIKISNSSKNLDKLTKLASPFVNILTPAHYTSECPTAGVFCFVIKDALEYAGIIPSKKPIISRLYHNANYNLDKAKANLEKIEKLKEKL